MKHRFLAAFALSACASAPSSSKPPSTVEIPRVEISEAPAQEVPAPRTATAPASTEVTYRGQLWTGGELLPVETVLKATDAGLSGHYEMIDGARRMPGELSNCFATDGAHFTCMWQDEFGVGGLDLELSVDRQQFTGEWWAEGSPGSRYPWSGSLVPPDAE